ncbi:RagB/SusD family nutrient uptake outer membrane protein [Tamlana sp. 2201CG12-4]|uniref:RagB/SusD family nutrient uptake outer membrane protein n=1 Tax=Tamlana sp. 2201CG12-4 TaxID=3112582 RepID=UPI002DB9C80E|nr:RagB/SusD family nutrient uptake outer membrane protein [Tamlana sp. 2201CG12-4]MEC3905518.1 RagB/SusD family nutrient uptake outer membrane protein [Tamlana sp. 2201CG12-4]
MKNLKYNTILLFIALFALGSCADVELDETPPSLLSPESFFTTESEFQAALAGTFLPLYSSWGGFDYAYPLIMTSGAEDVRSDAGIFRNLNSLSANDNDQSIVAVWQRMYQTIGNANVIIGNLKNAQGIPEDKLNAIEGQAKFIRAFCYFYMVRWFGEIQLTTFENQGDIENLRQSPVADVYASIIENLKDAEAKLPVSFPERGRPTQGAAKALLAKVYLTMAGWPIEDTSNYDLARDKAKELIDAGMYSLEANFEDLWKQVNRLTNTEFIFGFYGSIENDGAVSSHMHTASRHWGNGENGWGDFHSETRFFDVFPDGLRKDASFTSVFADGMTFEEAGVEPYIAKYRDAGGTVRGGLAGEGFNVLLRYADVLLMYAEAANMAEGGPSSDAYNAINAVRQRAGLADLTAGLSQSDFDDAVIAERNWELAFEMNRWFDLVRKKMVVEVNEDVHSGVTENNRLLPKPGAQLIPGILEQNPGY